MNNADKKKFHDKENVKTDKLYITKQTKKVKSSKYANMLGIYMWGGV